MVFASKICEKHLWKSVMDLHLYLKCHSSYVFFTHFASKNQLPGFSMIGKFAGNGLNES